MALRPILRLLSRFRFQITGIGAMRIASEMTTFGTPVPRRNFVKGKHLEVIASSGCQAALTGLDKEINQHIVR